MILRLLSPISRILSANFRSNFPARCVNSQMGGENLSLIEKKKHVNSRLINVSGFKTDLLEIHSQDPKLHVLFIPGNPGVVSFYTDFLESLYELLGGTASVTAIGHISHSEKDWESGRLFSLQEQINHKISFVEQEFQDVQVPIILVGHSIGAHISFEIFKRSHEKVIYCIALYPFLAVNTASSKQSSIRRIAASQSLCAALSSIGALLGMLPSQISQFLVRTSIGKSWSSSAVEVLCTHVLQYHTLRNMLFMAMTEFQMTVKAYKSIPICNHVSADGDPLDELPEKPDLDFFRGKRRQIAFLFGHDDHWGPLHLYKEEADPGFPCIDFTYPVLHNKIRKQVPDARLEVEREGHTHAFSCSEAGSIWVAQHVSSLIRNYVEIVKSI